MADTDSALAESIWETWGTSKTLRHEFAWRWVGWSLARQIRAMRKQRGWTQQELARRTGLSFGTINRYEKSCCHARLNGLIQIAAAFDVALVCRFSPFSELLVCMASGAVVVPARFEEEFGSSQPANAVRQHSE